jgi:hypothetical protein
MLPSTLIDSGVAIDFGSPIAWMLLGIGGVVLLVSIPVAQLAVLRSQAHRAWRWVPINLAAWIGITFTFLPGPFIDEYTPAAITSPVAAG